MDPQRIENFHTEIVTAKLGADESTFTVQINTPFDVEQMVFKTLSFVIAGLYETNMCYVRTNILGNEQTLCTIPGSVVQETYNNAYKVPSWGINGTYTFRLTDRDGQPYIVTDDPGPPAVAGEISISMTLLFIKWKK